MWLDWLIDWLIDSTTPSARLDNVPSGSPGQADFVTGHVTFKIHLPNGQRSEQVIF